MWNHFRKEKIEIEERIDDDRNEIRATPGGRFHGRKQMGRTLFPSW